MGTIPVDRRRRGDQTAEIVSVLVRVRVMNRASLVPSLDADIHFVLCDFGRAGLAYVETDPAEADATTIVQNLLNGQYERPAAGPRACR
jgi:hypothetical protein